VPHRPAREESRAVHDQVAQRLQFFELVGFERLAAAGALPEPLLMADHAVHGLFPRLEHGAFGVQGALVGAAGDELGANAGGVRGQLDHFKAPMMLRRVVTRARPTIIRAAVAGSGTGGMSL
jgi:hypothetical protein